MAEEQQDSKILRIAFGVTETLALLVGLPLALLSLMTLTVPFVTNVWIQLIFALIVGIGLPLLVADRILPEGQKAARWAGVPTDVFAITWMSIAFLVMGVGGTVTGPYLHQQADVLTTSPLASAGPFMEWVAGPRDIATPDDDDTKAVSPDAGTATADVEMGTDADTSVDATNDAGPDADIDPGPVTAKKGEEMSPAEVFQAAAPGVVSIGLKKKRGQRIVERGGGTGFFIDDKGTIVTNHHVIDSAEGAKIKLKDGRKTSKVEVLDTNKTVDIALLRIDPDDLEGGDSSNPDDIKALPMGDSDDIVTGEHVVAIGNPLGLEYTLTDGIVSARRVWRDRKMIQISVPISPGNSGGPLLDMHGNVVGIATATVGSPWQRAQNLNLAVPINKVKPLYDGEYPNRHKIGDSSSDDGTW